MRQVIMILDKIAGFFLCLLLITIKFAYDKAVKR